jgi:hypothetical protein
MYATDILDGLLRDLHWLRESAALRRRTRSLWSGHSEAARPLFCEVVIEWDDATLDGPAELVGC